MSRFDSIIDELSLRFSSHLPSNNSTTISIVSVSKQKLFLFTNKILEQTYPVSTAEAGIGNLSGSFQTPLGTHRIAEKIGANAPIATIFKGRQITNKFAKIINDPEIRSDSDNITSRILWLDGLENRINKGLDKNNNNVDSYSRYIYIHGTDEEGLLGQAASHGCIRMSNRDVIEFFDKTEVNDLVVIIND